MGMNDWRWNNYANYACLNSSSEGTLSLHGVFGRHAGEEGRHVLGHQLWGPDGVKEMNLRICVCLRLQSWCDDRQHFSHTVRPRQQLIVFQRVRKTTRLHTIQYNTTQYIFTARAYARAVLGVVILSVRPSVGLSVGLSVTRVDCDKTKWRTADIFIPHERAITLLLWYQEWLVGDAPFPLKSAFKMTHPIRKTPTSTDFRS